MGISCLRVSALCLTLAAGHQIEGSKESRKVLMTSDEQTSVKIHKEFVINTKGMQRQVVRQNREVEVDMGVKLPHQDASRRDFS